MILGLSQRRYTVAVCTLHPDRVLQNPFATETYGLVITSQNFNAKTALMKTSIYYINKLKQKLTEAQEKNPHYSLRAYARDLGIHPASLSLIIKSKRAFPLNSLDRVADALGLSENEKNLFLESVAKVKFSQKKEISTTMLKVSLTEDKVDEAEILITDFQNKFKTWPIPQRTSPKKYL